MAESRERLIDEAADLLYHLLVVLKARDIKLPRSRAVLGARTSADPGLAGKGVRAMAAENARIRDGTAHRRRRLSPYRMFSRAEWAALREDTPMTLTLDEVTRLRSLHDRLA